MAPAGAGVRSCCGKPIGFSIAGRGGEPPIDAKRKEYWMRAGAMPAARRGRTVFFAFRFVQDMSVCKYFVNDNRKNGDFLTLDFLFMP